MTTTGLRKISVLSMIIIIITEFQFATTVGTKKTCKGWIVHEGYQDGFRFSNSNRKHNHGLANTKNNNPNPDDQDKINVFALVYGQYTASQFEDKVISPSAFCKLTMAKSKHKVEIAFQKTEYNCPGWIAYYGFSTSDKKTKGNWEKTQKLITLTEKNVEEGGDGLPTSMHGITRKYLQEISYVGDDDAISVKQFCEVFYGHHLYSFDTRDVYQPPADNNVKREPERLTRPVQVGTSNKETEGPSSSVTAGKNNRGTKMPTSSDTVGIDKREDERPKPPFPAGENSRGIKIPILSDTVDKNKGEAAIPKPPIPAGGNNRGVKFQMPSDAAVKYKGEAAIPQPSFTVDENNLQTKRPMFSVPVDKNKVEDDRPKPQFTRPMPTETVGKNKDETKKPASSDTESESSSDDDHDSD